MSNNGRAFLLEKGPGFKSGLADFGKNLNSKTITTGIVATIFGVSGPALVTINAATTAGYTLQQTASWLFGIYVFGGLISIIMALYYKQPINGAFSIPGASMLGASLLGYSFNEAAASFIVAGVIVLLLGITGVMGKVMKWLPMPIVMGMIAGCMMRFGTGIVTSAKESPLICGAALFGFFIVPRFFKKMSPVLCALIFGVGSLALTGGFNAQSSEFVYYAPQIVIPHFNFTTVLSVSVPLAALVIGAENAQAIGVLYTQGYNPPVNSMTIISGFGGIASGLVGAHNANIAGPMTAICSSEEAGSNKDGRYTASVINGFLFAIFGLFSSFALSFVKMIPVTLISVLAGLSMVNVLINSLHEGFKSGKFRMGAFSAFIVGLSGLTIFQIGSAFWALVIGVVVSLICEKRNFDEIVAEKEKN